MIFQARSSWRRGRAASFSQHLAPGQTPRPPRLRLRASSLRVSGHPMTRFHHFLSPHINQRLCAQPRLPAQPCSKPPNPCHRTGRHPWDNGTSPHSSADPPDLLAALWDLSSSGGSAPWPPPARPAPWARLHPTVPFSCRMQATLPRSRLPPATQRRLAAPIVLWREGAQRCQKMPAGCVSLSQVLLFFGFYLRKLSQYHSPPTPTPPTPCAASSYVWARQGREGAWQGRLQTPPQSAARQHPGAPASGDLGLQVQLRAPCLPSPSSLRRASRSLRSVGWPAAEA